MPRQFEIIVEHLSAELARYTVVPGEYLIGRASASSIPIKVGPVSRQHARLVVDESGAVQVEDLASANGTQIDDTAISGPTAWTAGQPLRIGDVTLQLRAIEATRPPEDYAPTLSPSEADDYVPSPEATPAHGARASLPPSTEEAAIIARHLPLTDRKAQRLDVEKELARGGMGAVLQARESATRRTVAMKVMLRGDNAKATLRFIEEAQVTAQLEHPNIPPVHDLGIDAQGQPFYTMKLIAGIDLKKVLELLKARRPETVAKYPLGTLLTLFQKIGDALAFAHSKGVLHRDLKPANIMLGRFGEVMVMDWGLAKIIGTGSTQAETATFNPEVTVVGARREESIDFNTMDGSVMGTLRYMSPEQARGEVATLDARSDIFTLGTILYELATLERPFAGTTAAEIIKAITEGRFVPPAERVRAMPRAERPAHLPAGEVPASLDAIIRKALALDKAARYPSVTALQADLTAYQNGFATSAEKAGAGKQLLLALKRHKVAALGAAAVLVVGGGFGTKTFLVGRRAEREAVRANAALHDLRLAIPTFLEQAQTLVGQQRYDEAITKLDFALTIDERDADVLRLRGDYLQSALRLKDAATVYRRVLALRPDARAKANLILCERLLSQYGDAALPAPALDQLWTALLAQKRDAEAVPLTVRLAKNKEHLLPMIRSRLKAWSELPKWTGSQGDRISVRDGLVHLWLTDLAITDVEPLRGLPIERLSLRYLGVTDLRPLAGMRLRWLELSSGRMRDLSPLAGMPLEWITLDDSLDLDLTPLRGCPLKTVIMINSRITDIAPLRDCPLEELNGGGSQIRSVEPLRGRPVKSLMLPYCQNLTDITPLKDCTELEELGIPKDARNIEFLRHMPKIKKLCIDTPTPIPAAEFWADYDAQQAAGKK